MAATKKDLTNIEFNNDWKCYYQQSNDKTDKRTILAIAHSIDIVNESWSSIELPHLIETNQRETYGSKWWYRKQFDWTTIRQQPGQQLFLNFESANRHETKVTIKTTIWLDGKEIFSGSLTSLKNSIELSPGVLHTENPDSHLLVIRCKNTSLSLHASLMIRGRVICATGQVAIDGKNSDKNPTNVLDYTVSVDNTDGRIDVVFNPERELKVPFTTSQPPVQIHIDPDPYNVEEEHSNDDLLVPRLAIVILIVGTRGDVQPFIALGHALRRAGHRVRLATHETFRSFVRGNGLEFYPLAGDPADLMSFMVKNAGIIPSMSSIIEGDVARKRQSLSDILASTWLACIEDDDETKASFQAEVIIANPPSFGHIHCAEKLQIPLHIMFTMPWSPTTAFPHPLSNIEKSIGPKEKINFYSYDVIELLTWTGMHDIVNNFRRKTLRLRELNTSQATHILTDERVPHTYCWSPSLVAKPNDWGPHIDVSGFFFLDLGTTFTHPPTDLLDFLGINADGSQRDHQSLPSPIYIGFGSITGHDSGRILEVVIDALQQTGYRALLSGLGTETDELPPNIFRIGNVPHDWLFQYVSAVCHHGGAGTTAAGLRAGKPTIIVPFFGDQFFWGKIIKKSGAGPRPLPGKSIAVDKLVEALHFVHEPSTRAAAERIRDAILREDGCAAAVHAFHANLPLSRLHSDLEPTFAACYRCNKYNIQISRPVAQVLVTAGVLEESELSPHGTRKWQFKYDTRMHIPTHGIIRHSQKAFTNMFIKTASNIKRASSNENIATRRLEYAGTVAKGVGLGLGHLTLGCLALYGEVSDVLDLATKLYDPYSDSKAHPRPRVTNFKSGSRAAGLALWNGWKDGFTGIVRQPRAGYRRHGVLGGAAGSVIGTVNLGLKPAVGTMSSLTWIGRGTYASVRTAVETYRNEGRRISTKLFNVRSSNEENVAMHEDDDELVSETARKAAEQSGFHPQICQHILNEFEKIKQEHGQMTDFKVRKSRSLADIFTSRDVRPSSVPK